MNNNAYQITGGFFDGADFVAKRIGIYTLEEVGMFRNRLLELGYKTRETDGWFEEQEDDCDDEVEYRTEVFEMTLPQPWFDHHGDYIQVYCIGQIKTTPIGEAVKNIVAPQKWGE